LWGTAVLAAPVRSAAPPDSPEERELRALDLLVRAGRAFQGHRYVEAGALYRAAWALDPGNAQPLVLAGVAAYEAGHYTPARRDLKQALQAPLSSEDRDLARTYLDLISDRPPPPAAAPTEEPPQPAAFTPGIVTSVGAGYDSDARQLSRALDTDLLAVRAAGAPFLSGGLELSLNRPLGQTGEVDLRAGVDQRVQLDRALADLDSLEHEAAVELAQRLGRLVRLSLAATGTLSFSGLPDRLFPFQRALRLEPQIFLGRDPVRLRLGLGWQATQTLDPSLAHLSGRRLEVNATPMLTVAGWQAALTGRLRQDLLGTARTTDPSEQPCIGCFRERVVPYANLALAGALRVSGPADWRLRPGLSARWEMRAYELPERTETVRPGSRVASDARLRSDHRMALGASLHLRLLDGVVAGLRYDESVQDSRYTRVGVARCQSAICPMESRSDPSYHRRGIGFDLTVSWL
jgi:hypothetical protein